MEHKTAFIAIVGSPNAGKSTLINALVDKKVAITSAKPQTTRNRIAGVVTGKGYQLVFLDTPGLHSPKNKLDEIMQKTVYDAMRDVEAVLFVCDAQRAITEEELQLLLKLKERDCNIVVAINKLDAAGKHKCVEQAQKLSGIADDVFLISAKTGEGVDKLSDKLMHFLVPGPMFYPKDMYTDQSESCVVAETIRECALELLRDEVPHGICVLVESMGKREQKSIVDICAVIMCEKESHKGIIIGSGGRMLKRIGTKARLKIEQMLASKVYLKLWVKVEQDWRDSIRIMREIGYE